MVVGNISTARDYLHVDCRVGADSAACGLSHTSSRLSRLIDYSCTCTLYLYFIHLFYKVETTTIILSLLSAPNEKYLRRTHNAGRKPEPRPTGLEGFNRNAIDIHCT